MTPGRINNGLDWKRLQLILGVLNKHTQLRPYAADVYVNVLGGGSCNGCMGMHGHAMVMACQ